MSEPPADVEALARRRADSRAARDFASADALRAEIESLGWSVLDKPGGFELAPLPPWTTLRDLAAVTDEPSSLPSTRRATVALLVEGWPDDVRTCLDALVEHAPADVAVVVLDVGNVDGAGEVAHAYATEQPHRVEVVHVAGPQRFGPARAALLRRDDAPIHVWLESSTVLTGDALSPLLETFADDSVVGAGWHGVAVDDGWLAFHDAGAGDVEAVLGYLFAMRRSIALAVADDADSPFTTARFYRNADLDISFRLREHGGRLLALPDLPVEQTRHRGYHDADPATRDRESKRNYDHFLSRFRGREDLRTP